MDAIKAKLDEGGSDKMDRALTNTPPFDAQVCNPSAINRLHSGIREQVTRDLCRITKADCSKPGNARFFGTIAEYLANYVLPPIEEIREIPPVVHEFREIPRKK